MLERHSSAEAGFYIFTLRQEADASTSYMDFPNSDKELLYCVCI